MTYHVFIFHVSCYTIFHNLHCKFLQENYVITWNFESCFARICFVCDNRTFLGVFLKFVGWAFVRQALALWFKVRNGLLQSGYMLKNTQHGKHPSRSLQQVFPRIIYQSWFSSAWTSLTESGCFDFLLNQAALNSCCRITWIMRAVFWHEQRWTCPNLLMEQQNQLASYLQGASVHAWMLEHQRDENA